MLMLQKLTAAQKCLRLMQLSMPLLQPVPLKSLGLLFSIFNDEIIFIRKRRSERCGWSEKHIFWQFVILHP